MSSLRAWAALSSDGWLTACRVECAQASDVVSHQGMLAEPLSVSRQVVEYGRHCSWYWYEAAKKHLVGMYCMVTAGCWCGAAVTLAPCPSAVRLAGKTCWSAPVDISTPGDFVVRLCEYRHANPGRRPAHTIQYGAMC
jgi:hypothetical protein